MATKKKSSRPASRKAALTRVPSTASSRVPVRPASVGTLPPLRLRPSLERSLDVFAGELRDALDAANAAIEALSAEVAQLRARHDQHTHTYSASAPGSGGNFWVELRFLKNHLEGKHPQLDTYKILTRESSNPGGDHTTGPPNP